MHSRRVAITAATGLALLAALLAAAAAGAQTRATGTSAATARGAAASVRVPPPVHRGTLRIAGRARDGGVVSAAGLRWSPGRLPRGTKLLSFAVAYTWQSLQR